MKARLVARLRPGATRLFELPEGEAIVGRERDAHIALNAHGVSRRHARIVWDGQHHYLEDLKSTNGTFVNGQLIHREKLQHLDVVTLGRHCDLVFILSPARVSSIPPTQPVPRQSSAAAAPEDPVEGRRPPRVRVTLVGPGLEEQLSEPGYYVLGRGSQTRIRLDCTSVSRRHAALVLGDDGQSAWIEDLGSSNGTRVNGAAVERTRLSDGDVITLGQLSLVVSMES